jgi:radical SAM superfamily enzyme YgiQ (UPF0313 family)
MPQAMTDIVLATFNAKYLHPAFGLRCILANLGPLKECAVLLEFDLQVHPSVVADKILAAKPRIVGIGVYIWNLLLVRQLVTTIRSADPSVLIVLGGPEAGYASDDEPAVIAADYVIAGDGENVFRELCSDLLAGRRPAEKRIAAEPPDLARMALPYDLYTDDDIAHKMIYVEATRGCPFRCEYCVSSLDHKVRRFPLPAFLAAMDRLLTRGVRHFKFVDRSFNANGRISLDVLDFFLERLRPGLILHFELVPDRLPTDMLARFRRFPPGALHFEVGIQSFNPSVNSRIGRVQDNRKAESCMRHLRRETSALIHADLIVGLPGEDIVTFGRGFDRLLRLLPHEIQVNPLKNLPGTAIIRHSRRWGMVFSPDPPYEVLETKSIPRADMDRLHRFARYWNLYYNSGRFPLSLRRLWTDWSRKNTEASSRRLGRRPRPTQTQAIPGGRAKPPAEPETRPRSASDEYPFAIFLRFSDWLFTRFGRAHALPLNELAGALFAYLRSIGDDPTAAAAAVRADYQHKARREVLKLKGSSGTVTGSVPPQSSPDRNPIPLPPSQS